MKNELATIDFYGDRLLAIKNNESGVVYVPIKPICQNNGLDRNGQVQRIQRHPVLSEGVCMIHTPSENGDQSTFCLRLDLVTFWLATIDINRVKEDRRERLFLYQKEVVKALNAHFFGIGNLFAGDSEQLLLFPDTFLDESIPLHLRLGKLHQVFDSINNSAHLIDEEKRALTVFYHNLFNKEIRVQK